MLKKLLPKNNFLLAFNSSLIIFTLGIIFGCVFLSSVTDTTSAKESMNELEKLIKGSFNLPHTLLGLALFILGKNLLASALAVVGGLLTLGIVPVLTLFFNGIVVGYAIKPVLYLHGTGYLMASLLPHGIIELPAFFLSASVGMYLGVEQALKFIRNRPPTYSVKDAAKFFTYIIFPVLLAAAFIEVFITPLFMIFLT
ncbi:protein of unknown function DUF95 transmembrane [Desulfofarcimen acetoxidans DSM 771]|uniref:Stage II sporulation protein M n=1 Tax=Desulfofarcimen acetoxidans (strain ATCC 49208 / DSM 771 / KCTC 5769 / VKM B-1644 / 5575) TaxID=485916 RepID=C8VX37_DESAS|nr:stage II sporulation protein M [Desulfofarcimen acetoxidans]ACV62613.1 protein of unknown function DUF95 transmembrane [Desulfofarcimen acetoxidans DSM 771]